MTQLTPEHFELHDQNKAERNQTLSFFLIGLLTLSVLLLAVNDTLIKGAI